MLTPDKARAFLAAEYDVVDAGDRFVLHVGTASAPLRALLDRHGADGCAYLTACNPGTAIHNEADNTAAMDALRRDAAAWPCYEGAGSDPAGKWPAEASVLVVGIGCGEARALARRYGQDAFLYAVADAVPRLVATDASEQPLVDRLRESNDA